MHHFNRPALELIQKECLDLGEKKSHDYSSVADGIGIAGVYGVVVRMLDKILRLMSLCIPGFQAQVKDESIRDTLKDIINYATYAVSVMDHTWGKEPVAIALDSLQGQEIFLNWKKDPPKKDTSNLVGFVLHVQNGITHSIGGHSDHFKDVFSKLETEERLYWSTSDLFNSLLFSLIIKGH